MYILNLYINLLIMVDEMQDDEFKKGYWSLAASAV